MTNAVNKPSKGEKKLIEIFKKNNIIFKREFSFMDLTGKKQVPLRFDFAIFNKDGQLVACVDYDGRQHFEYVPYFHKTYSGFLRSKERDRQKNRYCLIKGIIFIRVPYWDLDKLTLERIFKEPSYRVRSKYHTDDLIKKGVKK